MYATVLLLHDHSLPGRKDALLMAVRLRLAEIFNHREAQCLRRAKAEQPRVANIQ